MVNNSPINQLVIRRGPELFNTRMDLEFGTDLRHSNLNPVSFGFNKSGSFVSFEFNKSGSFVLFDLNKSDSFVSSGR